MPTKLININPSPAPKVDPDFYPDPYTGGSDPNNEPTMAKMFHLHQAEAQPIPAWLAEGIQLHPEYRAQLIRYLLSSGLSKPK